MEATNVQVAAKQKNRAGLLKLLLAFAALSMIGIVGVTGYFLLQQKDDREFQPIAKVPTIPVAITNAAIKSGVKLDNRVTLSYLRSKTTISRFESQGVHYTVFRIAAPETCGKFGCLHIVKPDEGLAKLLQLQAIPPKSKLFTASTHAGCFTTVQPQAGNSTPKLKDFEICQ
jgi:hypothetical protein